MEDGYNDQSVVYILYTTRGELVFALEMYQCRYEATHTLPERAESLHTQRDKELWLHYSYESLYTPTDIVAGIALRMSYLFTL